MRRFLLLFCASLLNVIIALANANDQGYYYHTWTFEANVAADNTWNVQEHYDVFFTERRHGIYRYLQNEFGANRNLNPDGEARNIQYRKYIPKINVVAASGAETDITEDDDNHCTVVRWGSSWQEVIGDQSYGLHYTYQTPDDRIEARDYIYHSILPADVKTHTEVFSFKLTFDKSLPSDIAERLHIYCGAFGGEDPANVENLIVNEHEISGVIHDIPSYFAVTIYAELPEGYYEGTRQTDKMPGRICYYLTIAFALMLLYYELTEHGPSITKSVQFYAPEDITPTLVGKIIDGSTDNIDIAALIPWLAQEGYIKITEIPKEKGLFGKAGDVVLKRLKELPDDAPNYQRKIMDLLFCKDDELYMSKMGDRHTRVKAAKDAVDVMFKGRTELSTTNHILLIFALLVVSTLCVLFSSPVDLLFEDQIIGASMWGVTFATALFLSIGSADKNLFASPFKKLLKRAGRICAFLFCMCVIYFIMINVADNFFSSTEILLFVGLCFLACELSERTVKDTPYRAEMAGKLLGFREFIETAEKDRLKMLVDQDPSYFYKVLPYAMIFGLTKKWSNLFQDIEVQPAPWYHSTQAFNSYQFVSSINNMSSSISNAINTSAVDHTKSSSGGSFSGGGFSGGGGGGGGAGSW